MSLRSLLSLPDEGEVSFQFPNDISLQTFSDTGSQDYGNQRHATHDSEVAKMRDVFFSLQCEVGLFRINKKSRLANELCEEGAAGRKKNLLTSSRALLNACQAGYLQADWSDCYWFPGKAGSRIRDQLKIYQINYPYVTQGFLEKPDQGSRIKDHDSWSGFCRKPAVTTTFAFLIRSLSMYIIFCYCCCCCCVVMLACLLHHPIKQYL